MLVSGHQGEILLLVVSRYEGEIFEWWDTGAVAQEQLDKVPSGELNSNEQRCPPSRTVIDIDMLLYEQSRDAHCSLYFAGECSPRIINAIHAFFESYAPFYALLVA